MKIAPRFPLVTLALLVAGALVVVPVGAMVVASLRVDYVETAEGVTYGHIRDADAGGVTIREYGGTTSRLVPRSEVIDTGEAFSLQNYRHVLARPAERAMLLATLALAGAATLLAVLIGLPLGLLFAATDLPGRRLWEMLATLPLVLPPILLAIATYRDLLGVRPEFLRAVLVFGLSLFPLVSLFTARAIRTVGADALDAARLHTSPRDALFRAALAPALPGAAAGALLVFAFCVSDFAVPDFLGVTTAQNTIRVYANAVFTYWNNDGNTGAAAAAGMPPTLLAVAALALVLRLESKTRAASVDTGYREVQPVPLGRGRWLALLLVAAVIGVALVLPTWRHLEIAGGAHFGEPVAAQGAARSTVDAERARPDSILDGLGKGVRFDRVGESAWNSIVFASGGALLAVLAALLLVEAGRRSRRLDHALLFLGFLPIAVPPMSLTVGAVSVVGSRFAATQTFPVLLLAVRLLPFATLAVRAARAKIGSDLLEAGSLAGLSPERRYVSVTLPLLVPGAALGFLLAFLFGLREVDALVFTKSGTETIPVQLYNMIHYGYDVQVAGLSFLWTAGVMLLLLLIRFVAGSRFRMLP